MLNIDQAYDSSTKVYSDITGDEPWREMDFEDLGIDPSSPTGARPGSEEKVLMLAARYATGVPLWHESDCADHGPAESDLKGPQALTTLFAKAGSDDSESETEEEKGENIDDIE